MSKNQLKTSAIYCGDNLEMLKEIPDESIDLIYIDPPFNSNRNYEVFWGDTGEKRAFYDRFGDATAYIQYMRPRVLEMYRVLKKTGSFYYHCDWHAGHYVKIMLDQIFNFNNFHNEIIWKRTHAHNDPNQYGRNSDKIFFYTKTGNYTWHTQYSKYDEDYIENFFRNKDEKGKYQLVILTGPKINPNDPTWKGYNPKTSNRSWSVPKRIINRLVGEEKAKKLSVSEKLDILFENNYIEISKNGIPRFKQYLHEMEGVPLQEIWTDIPPISALAKERLGYPTQKPLGLLERIINSSSNKGDVVLDTFCGCGTALIASEKLGRKWIGIDISPTACRVMAQRLWDAFKLDEGKDFKLINMLRNEKQLREIPPFEFENWAVIAMGGIPNRSKVGDFGIDGKLYPIEREKVKSEEQSLFGDVDIYYPIQVKQKDKASRPDIDGFETAMRRDKRRKGYFISFDFTEDAIKEIKRLDQEEDLEIIPVTVKELLDKSGHELRV